jgi:hypothetical protein
MPAALALIGGSCSAGGAAGDEPARERGEAATGPAAHRGPEDSPIRVNAPPEMPHSVSACISDHYPAPMVPPSPVRFPLHLPSFSATSGFPTCLGPHSFSLRLTITGQHSGQHHRFRLVTPRASDPVCLRLSRAPTRTGRRTTPCPRGNSSPPVHRISTGYLTQVSQVRTVVLLNISITEDGGLPWQP